MIRKIKDEEYDEESSQEEQPDVEDEGEGVSEGEEEDEDEELERDLQTVMAEYLAQKQASRQFANDIPALKDKLKEIKLKIPGYDEVPWVETLVISSPDTGVKVAAEDDFARERHFYDTALKAANEGFDKLIAMGIPYKRPDDFFAEMIKSDDHMKKIKGTLLKQKRTIEEAQQRTKIRMQKKFAKKIQVESVQRRQKEKKESLQAIKKWRKTKGGSGEEFPEDLLSTNHKSKKLSNSAFKAQKYGMGGKKRGSKRNDSNSAADTRGWSTARNKSREFKSAGKKKAPASSSNASRPGKRKRQEGWTSSGGRKQKRQRT